MWDSESHKQLDSTEECQGKAKEKRGKPESKQETEKGKEYWA